MGVSEAKVLVSKASFGPEIQVRNEPLILLCFLVKTGQMCTIDYLIKKMSVKHAKKFGHLEGPMPEQRNTKNFIEGG